LEFRDNLRLRYGLRPLELQERCDGCGAGFTVQHGLSCKVGGLIIRRHEAGRHEFQHLCELAFSKSRVDHEPFIFYGGDATAMAGEAAAGGRKRKARLVAGNEARGDLSVDGFWKAGMTCILDIRITDTDCKSNIANPPQKTLDKAEREKKAKYSKPCAEQRRHFTPLVYSPDGMPGTETRAAEKRLAAQLAAKLDRPYSEMAGFVRQRMSLAVVRQNTLLLRGARVRRNYGERPVMMDGAGMEDMRSREW
jgi:hypothetical protein